MSSRWAGFFIWALAAFSAVSWSLRIVAAAHALPIPPDAYTPTRTVAMAAPLTHLFGATPVTSTEPAPAASTRFVLTGVIAPPTSSEGDAPGSAVISVDGQPPRAWRVGTAVDGDTWLLAVDKHHARLGPRGGPAAFTLDVPDLPSAATGSLPAATTGTPNPVLNPAPPGFRFNRPGVPPEARPNLGNLPPVAAPSVESNLPPQNQE